MPDNGKQIIEDDAREEAIKQAMRRGDFDQAEQLCHQWIAAVEGHWVPFAQMMLAELAMQRGDYAEAERLLTTMQNLSDRQQAAVLQGQMAKLAIQRGDYSEAERLFREWIAAMEELGDQHQVAVAQGMLAQLFMVTNRHDEGCALLKEAAQTLRAIGAVHDADMADEMISELCDASPQQEQPDILELIATSTIAVMTERQDKREEWSGAMQQLKAQAQQYNDTPMISLVEAVLKLLGGDTIESIKPELEGPPVACWDQIVAGIKSPPE